MKTNRPHSTSAACRQAQDVLLLDAAPADTTTRIRVERHVGHCDACQAVRADLAATRATVQAATPPLDDLRRARMLAQLAPAIDELAARAAGARARRLGWIPGTPPGWQLVSLAALAGAACLVVAVGVRRHRAPHETAPVVAATATIAVAAPAAAPLPVPATPSVAPPAAATQEAPALIQPYRIVSAGRDASPVAARWLNQRFAHLRTPAGTKVRAHVGPRTRVTLVGNTDVAVQAATPEVLDLTLDEGTLVADFDHRDGTRLRIHSPGALTEVTGTLFSIEVRGGASRVSVAHGRVLVQPATGAARVVSAGQSWQSDTPAAEPIAPITAALMAEHDAATRGSISKPLDVATRKATPAGPPLTSALAAATTSAPPATTLTPAPPATAAPPAQKATPTRLALAASPRTPAAPSAVPAPAAAAAPAAVPPAAPGEAPAPPPAADALYTDAERAMRRRDWAGARRALEQVVAMAAPGALPDVARYELAQLALRTGDDARAGRWLDALLASDREPALREPARLLRCELSARAGDAALARRCLETFRAGTPQTGRDALALGWLLRLTAARGPCTTVRPLADEYLQRYPDGPDAALAAQRKTQCLP